jgi:hypothetical protein
MLCWCPPTIRTFSMRADIGRPEIPLSQHPSDFGKNVSENGAVLCTVRIGHYGGLGGRGEVIFPGILPTQRRHFSHEFAPLPPPPFTESKF